MVVNNSTERSISLDVYLRIHHFIEGIIFCKTIINVIVHIDY